MRHTSAYLPSVLTSSTLASPLLSATSLLAPVATSKIQRSMASRVRRFEPMSSDFESGVHAPS